MDSLLHVTTVLSVVLLAMVLISVRRMLLLSLNRPVLEAITRWTGVPDSPLTLFLITGTVFLVMFFRFSVIISHLRDDNVALAQRVAMLEYRVRSFEQE